MNRPIAYDLVRLMLGPFARKPRGIDRIDFGICSRLFESWPGECVGVLPLPWGVRWFPRDRILRARDVLQDMWEESRDADTDPAFADLLERMTAGTAGDGMPSAISLQMGAAAQRIRGVNRFLRLLAGERWSLGNPMQTLPQGAVYLNIGHYGLAVPSLLSWLDGRPDVARLFMLHDLIPFEHPELVAASTNRAHQALFRATIRHADAIITPSAAAAAAVRVELLRRRGPPIPVHSAPLPVDDLFCGSQPAASRPVGRPYFVAVGAIEPRKNQSMLMTIWPEIIRQTGQAPPPQLILAGSPGHESSTILASAGRSLGATNDVIFAPGLSSPALARLIAGARALLMPSVAEGFGLPPVEALTLGTPVIVSDIPAHREVLGVHGLFLDPHMPSAWRDAIAGASTDGPDYRDLRRRAADFVSFRWPSYMDRLGTIIEDFRQVESEAWRCRAASFFEKDHVIAKA